MTRLQLKVDNGPESSSVRTQLLKRMVEVRRRHGKNHSVAVPPAVPRQIRSHRTVLGRPGTALEWDHAGGYQNPVGMGARHDLEGHSTDRHTAPHHLSERRFPVQEGHAGDRSPIGTQPTLAQVGSLDPTRLMGIFNSGNRLTGGFISTPFLPACSSPLPPSARTLPGGFARLKLLANQDMT